MHPEKILEAYMQPIFYFLLRKTSDRAEAEDLTQTVDVDDLRETVSDGTSAEDMNKSPAGIWMYR